MTSRTTHDRLYRALLERDPRYEGRRLVGVTSTGIFCRLTCPARKPKSINCVFYRGAAQCLEAGFRPCKRCRPLEPVGAPDATVSALLAALERDPARRWCERDLLALGHDPSTVRRAFKRHVGTTFLALARQRRLGHGLRALAAGSNVVDAQLDAGFESASGFRTARARSCR